MENKKHYLKKNLGNWFVHLPTYYLQNAFISKF